MVRYYAVSAAACFLAGCAGAPAVLPHREVLERAVLASQKLDSADFTLAIDGVFDGPSDARGSLHIEGSFTNGGRALSGLFDLSMEREGASSATSVDTSGAATVLDETDIYIRFDSLAYEPKDVFVFFRAVEPFVGRWISLSQAGLDEQDRITPDPQFLRAQASLIEVVRNHGLVRDNGTYAYHYDIRLDREKFFMMFPDAYEAYAEESDRGSVGAEGEVWIDARTFYIKRVKWNLENVPVFSGFMRGTVDMALSDHDRAHMLHTPEDPMRIAPDVLGLPLPEEP